jgi:hypothetical protein
MQELILAAHCTGTGSGKYASLLILPLLYAGEGGFRDNIMMKRGGGRKEQFSK